MLNINNHPKKFIIADRSTLSQSQEQHENKSPEELLSLAKQGNIPARNVLIKKARIGDQNAINSSKKYIGMLIRHKNLALAKWLCRGVKDLDFKELLQEQTDNSKDFQAFVFQNRGCSKVPPIALGNQSPEKLQKLAQKGNTSARYMLFQKANRGNEKAMKLSKDLINSYIQNGEVKKAEINARTIKMNIYKNMPSKQLFEFASNHNLKATVQLKDNAIDGDKDAMELCKKLIDSFLAKGEKALAKSVAKQLNIQMKM